VTGDYVGTPTECFACHSADYEGSTAPDHMAANFGTDCERCHGVFSSTWGAGDFIHDQVFPLTGEHRRIDCLECHSDGFAGTPTECVACHQAVYDNSTDPNHVLAGFPAECQVCHVTEAWTPADYDHNATAFPLTGAHRPLDCLECHSTGFVGTPTDCVACHQTEYDDTTDPGHIAAGFPVDCTVCHTTAAWTPADFDHNATNFPLTGAHVPLDCSSCHSDGYTGIPTDCYACHQSEYNGTNDPNHLAAGFPISCEDCHTTSVWDPSTWDHDVLFPIYSGKHREKWDTCNECHVVPTNYAAFECILCHEHNNRNDVDDDHRGEDGYEYLSAACFECHPRGDD